MPNFGKEEMANLAKVIESGVMCDTRGGFMDEFRSQFAKALDSKHAIAGATAMLLMHAIPGAIGAGAGDEIICDPVVQFHGIACLHNNIVPVWADIRPDNFLMDADKVEALITKRTKAIWVTHLWGFAAEVDKLRAICDKHGIYLLEDCAHALLSEYKGKKIGTWGHVGTFSFNMGKQLPTGEGGMAIVNDDKIYFELNRRIIFSESPEVLSSNYRMTELQAAVGVAQLAKVPGYLAEYREGKKVLDEAIGGCDWLNKRENHPDNLVSPYLWSCLFHGEGKGVELPVFKAALKQAGAPFGVGFTMVPAYKYNFFKIPNAYGNKGCPYNCHLYDGKVDWRDGLCPVAEDTIPRIVYFNNMKPLDTVKAGAEILKKAIELAVGGNVKPLEYTDLDMRILNLVRDMGPLEPSEVIGVFDANKWEHFDEQAMIIMMSDLRDRFPYKLARSGPRKFSYHDLS